MLQVISSSVADTQPVFEKILDSCEVLVGADQMLIALVKDEQVHLGAWRGERMSVAAQTYPKPLAQTLYAQAIRRGTRGVQRSRSCARSLNLATVTAVTIALDSAREHTFNCGAEPTIPDHLSLFCSAP